MAAGKQRVKCARQELIDVNEFEPLLHFKSGKIHFCPSLTLSVFASELQWPVKPNLDTSLTFSLTQREQRSYAKYQHEYANGSPIHSVTTQSS